MARLDQYPSETRVCRRRVPMPSGPQCGIVAHRNATAIMARFLKRTTSANLTRGRGRVQRYRERGRASGKTATRPENQDPGEGTRGRRAFWILRGRQRQKEAIIPITILQTPKSSSMTGLRLLILRKGKGETGKLATIGPVADGPVEALRNFASSGAAQD